MKKNAFSLAEILIGLTIIGVVSLVTIISVKPTEKTMRTLYARAFTTLKNASLLAYEKYENDPSVETTKEVRNFIGNSRADGKSYCEGILEYINTVENQTTCEEYNTPSKNEESFIGANGMKFWVGKPKTSYSASNHKFIVVYVDLNGNAGPNTKDYKKKGKMGDIVPFGVLDNGEVVPLGEHADDTRYIAVNLISENETGQRSILKQSTDYCTARGMAWGSGIRERDMTSLKDIMDEKFSSADCKRPGQDTNCRPGNKKRCFIEFPKMD